jgi:hypothetical protein
VKTPLLAKGSVSMTGGPFDRIDAGIAAENPAALLTIDHRLAGDEADHLVVPLGKGLDGRFDAGLVEADGKVGGLSDFRLEQIQGHSGDGLI